MNKTKKYCRGEQIIGQRFSLVREKPWHVHRQSHLGSCCLPVFDTSRRYSVTQSHKWNMANTDNINECMTNDSLNGKSSSGESLKFVKKLYIHGGNISNWNRIKRKTTPSSADEVSLIIDVSGNNITWLSKR